MTFLKVSGMKTELLFQKRQGAVQCEGMIKCKLKGRNTKNLKN